MTDRTCARPDCNAAPSAHPGYGRPFAYCDEHPPRQRQYRSDLRASRGVVPPKMTPARPCVECGSTIPPKKQWGPAPTRCSRKCKAAADISRRKRAGTYSVYVPKKKPLTERLCAECKSPFMAKRVDAELCSPICGNRRRDRINPLRCTEDGCDRAVRGKGLCSMHWRRAARADGREANPEWDERRQANWSRRRARKQGAPEDERLVHSDVFERDGWMCGLCNVAVDESLAWPDPMSASLDHILPLAKGGTHLLANVQLAHLVCNVRKGDRVAA